MQMSTTVSGGLAAAGADADTVAAAGGIAAAAESGYASAKQAIEDGSVTPGEAAGLVLAGAAAGSTVFPPIGTAVGAIAGLAVAVGVAISDWLSGARQHIPAVTVWDRYAFVKRPAKAAGYGRRAPDWKLGRQGMEISLAHKQAGNIDFGSLLWLMRRINEDGGGAAEWKWLMASAGLPYTAPNQGAITPAAAFEAGAPVAALWRSLSFVPSAKKQISREAQTYAGARALGADVPAARGIAGLPRNVAAERFLTDLRERLRKEAPPMAVRPMSVTDLRKVSPAALRLVADQSQARTTVRSVDPSVLRRAVLKLRSQEAEASSGGELAVGAAVVAAAGLGWYFLRGRK